MKIKNISLRNFRGIDQLDLDLQGKSAILFGINGVGKSSILSAINLLYAPLLNKLTRRKVKQTINIGLSDIKEGKVSTEISAEFMFNGCSESFPLQRSMTHENKRTINTAQLERLVDYYQKFYVGEEWADEENNLIMSKPGFNIPIFVNYSVNRLVLKTPLRFQKKNSNGQYDAYEKAIENQIAFDKLFEWFFDQEFYENLVKKDEREYQDKELKAVKTAMLAMFDDYWDIHIVAKPYSMRIVKENSDLDILQMSDGEKCTLALFGDIAKRLSQANPSLYDPLKGEGVVLIDELELHMYTSWQRKIVPALIKTFPNIQFIMTTHSPQILGEVGEEFQVFSLFKDKKEIKKQVVSSLYGVDSNAILEDSMHTDSVSQQVKQKVDKMYDFIEQKNYHAAEKMADTIDQLTHNRNIDTVRARIIIRRGKSRNA